MFERFTHRARRVLVLAQDEARVLGHNFIGTEHILLGVAVEGEGVGAKALAGLGLSADGLRRRIKEVIGPAGAPAKGAPPFTPRAKKVLELSLREALQLGHNYIGTEHIVLGLAREGTGVAAQVLLEQGATPERIKAAVMALLTGFNPPERLVPSRTPAAGSVSTRAQGLAGSAPIGTQHYLLALLHDADSLAARVLAGLGVTREAVAARIDEIGVAGTSDEIPGLQPVQIETTPGVRVVVTDPVVAERIKRGELRLNVELSEAPTEASTENPGAEAAGET